MSLAKKNVMRNHRSQSLLKGPLCIQNFNTEACYPQAPGESQMYYIKINNINDINFIERFTYCVCKSEPNKHVSVTMVHVQCEGIAMQMIHNTFNQRILPVWALCLDKKKKSIFSLFSQGRCVALPSQSFHTAQHQQVRICTDYVH